MKYDWVTQEGRIEERVLRNEIKNIVKNQKLSNAQIVAFYTDEIVIDLFWKNGREVDLNREMEKNFLSQERLRLLLELRIFNETKELKIWRSVIGETFFFRIADDKKINEENQFKVENYLYIDEKVGKLEENNNFVVVQSTRGGRYKLPFHKIHNAKVKITHYIDYYEETGQASLEDWRIVKIVEGEK